MVAYRGQLERECLTLRDISSVHFRSLASSPIIDTATFLTSLMAAVFQNFSFSFLLFQEAGSQPKQVAVAVAVGRLEEWL